MRVANLALRFVLELCALAALGYGGWHVGGSLWVRLLLALLAPIAGAAVWGAFVAPRARYPIGDPLRLLPEWVVFGGATVALALTGHPVLGGAFAVLAAGNRALLRVIGSDTDGTAITD